MTLKQIADRLEEIERMRPEHELADPAYTSEVFRRAVGRLRLDVEIADRRSEPNKLAASPKQSNT